MSNYEFNKDCPAKRKPDRPKRVITAEEGAAQIMAVINGDTPPRNDRTCAAEAHDA